MLHIHSTFNFYHGIKHNIFHLFHSCYALLYHAYPQIIRIVFRALCEQPIFSLDFFFFVTHCGNKYVSLFVVFLFLHIVFTVMADATYYCFALFFFLRWVCRLHIITIHRKFQYLIVYHPENHCTHNNRRTFHLILVFSFSIFSFIATDDVHTVPEYMKHFTRGWTTSNEGRRGTTIYTIC